MTKLCNKCGKKEKYEDQFRDISIVECKNDNNVWEIQLDLCEQCFTKLRETYKSVRSIVNHS